MGSRDHKAAANDDKKIKRVSRAMAPFHPYLEHWRLRPDGASRSTPSSDLLPVRCDDGRLAMLKVPREDEERRGSALMVWWAGDGAAAVLAHDAETGALLMERATGARSLAAMAREGQDDEATRILCAAADRLHARRASAPPRLAPLADWFRQLEPGAQKYGGLIANAAEVARRLLANQQEITVLHGDLHHDNVLDGGARGWLVIDPTGLLGERTFDYANLLFNPEVSPIVTAPGRFARQIGVIAEAARLDRTRLLQWVLAYGGLSAVWRLDDGQDVLHDHDVAIAEMAAAELKL